MNFERQAIRSITILLMSIATISVPKLVVAQTAESIESRANIIQARVAQTREIATMCQDVFDDIQYKLDGNNLLIITGDHQCSYQIVDQVLQPQLQAGTIKTYEFTGDQEDVIVTF